MSDQQLRDQHQMVVERAEAARLAVQAEAQAAADARNAARAAVSGGN
jgi:hypothetical protein